MRRLSVFAAASALLAGCGSDEAIGGGGDAGTGGTGATDGGVDGSGGSAGAGQTTLSFPQAIGDKAFVDSTLHPTIRLVIEPVGDAPEKVDVVVGGTTIVAEQESDRFVASLDVSGLAAGDHAAIASAMLGGETVATAELSLRVRAGSARLTEFDSVGPTITATVHHDAARDRALATWVDVRDGTHHAYLATLDGHGAKVGTDRQVDTGAARTLRVHSALGSDTIGLHYQEDDGAAIRSWFRVAELDGDGLGEPIDLSGSGSTAFGGAVAWDGEAYGVAWKQIDAGEVEIRWARIHPDDGLVAGPLAVMRTDDANGGSLGGLGPLSMACSARVCALAYPRKLYNALVDLDLDKVRLAVIDVGAGALSSVAPVDATDWDLQADPAVTRLDSGEFLLTYTRSDTRLVSADPCDDTLGRYIVYGIRLDVDAEPVSVAPYALVDEPAVRFQTTLAPYGERALIAWEDQRSQCAPMGANRLAINVADITAPEGAVVDPYLELPESVLLGQSTPSLMAVGTNGWVAWTDNRNGLGIIDPRPELFLDALWRD